MLEIQAFSTRMFAVWMYLVLAPAVASANPDVWIKASSTWHLESAGMKAVTLEWRFDKFFSSRSIGTYDGNRSGVLEPEEVARLQAEVFEPLARFDYYVHVWAGGDRQRSFTIDEFTARIDGVHLVFRFTLALRAAVDPNDGPVVVSLHDPKTAVDFQFAARRFLLVEGALNPRCKFRVRRGQGALSGHAQPITLSCGG